MGYFDDLSLDIESTVLLRPSIMGNIRLPGRRRNSQKGVACFSWKELLFVLVWMVLFFFVGSGIGMYVNYRKKNNTPKNGIFLHPTTSTSSQNMETSLHRDLEWLSYALLDNPTSEGWSSPWTCLMDENDEVANKQKKLLEFLKEKKDEGSTSLEVLGKEVEQFWKNKYVPLRSSTPTMGKRLLPTQHEINTKPLRDSFNMLSEAGLVPDSSSDDLLGWNVVLSRWKDSLSFHDPQKIEEEEDMSQRIAFRSYNNSLNPYQNITELRAKVTELIVLSSSTSQ